MSFSAAWIDDEEVLLHKKKRKNTAVIVINILPIVIGNSNSNRFGEVIIKILIFLYTDAGV